MMFLFLTLRVLCAVISVDADYCGISSEITISTSAEEAGSVFASDVDGDGDMDSLSEHGRTIAWYVII